MYTDKDRKQYNNYLGLLSFFAKSDSRNLIFLINFYYMNQHVLGS